MSTPMISVKGVLVSKTMWGAFIAAVPAVIQLLETTRLVPVGLLGPVVGSAVSAAGAILAAWGRLKAEKKISGLF